MTEGRGTKRVSVVLRISSLGLRSILVVLLARYLSVDDLGLYGLLVVTISYAIYPLGLDFYTYATRELVRHPRTKWPTFIRSQVGLTALLYVGLTPLFLGLFQANLLPWSLALWFIPLVLLEHVGAEMDRILIAAMAPFGASVGLFIRQALMPLAVVPIIALAPAARSLQTVLSGWLAFDLAGVMVGTLLVWFKVRGHGVGIMDWAWVRRGIRICLPFLIGTLCLRALFTFDRQVLRIWSDPGTLAAYTLFATIGAGMTNLISSGVLQFSYPRLLKAARDGSIRDLKHVLRSMLAQTLAAAIGISAVAVGGLPILLHFVHNPTYQENSWILPWIMLATSIYNVSLVPHFVMYAMDGDRAILYVTVFSLIAFLLLVAIFVRDSPPGAVLAGLMAASVVLILGKTWSASRLWASQTETWKVEVTK